MSLDCAVTLRPQKTSTRHGDQQRRNKDSRRKPGPRLRHNETAEQISSDSHHHDPDEPLDQTIWIAGRHTPMTRLRHAAHFGANRDIEGRQLLDPVLNPTDFNLANYGRYVRLHPPIGAGADELTEIRRANVNAWVADLAASRGPVSARRALATLRMIFSAAVRDEIIPANQP